VTHQDEPPELLTTAETAAIFRVARSTVIAWAKRGLLPHTATPTGHLRFYRGDVERLLRRQHRDAVEDVDDGS
jgi:excisionase family DNA binding protein